MPTPKAQPTPGPWYESAGRIWADTGAPRGAIEICIPLRHGDVLSRWRGDAERIPTEEDIANARLIAEAPEGFTAAETAYLALLSHPHDDWRAHNQTILCTLRDYIAKALGREQEDVQDEYEARALLARIDQPRAGNVTATFSRGRWCGAWATHGLCPRCAQRLRAGRNQ